MALIKCPECGHQVSDKAYSCPNCGYPLNDLVDNEIVSREQPINQEEQPPINNKYEISEQWQEYVERINGKSIFERTLSKLKRTISSKIETWKSTHNNSSSLAKIDQKDEYKISKQWQEYVQEQNCENSFHRNLIHHKRNLKRHFRNYYANHKSTIITVLVVFIAMCVVVAFAIWLAVSGTTSKKSNTPTTVTSNQTITQDTKSKQKKIDTIRIKISCKNPLEFDFPLSLSQMRKIEREWDRQSYSMYDWSVWGSIVLYYCIDSDLQYVLDSLTFDTNGLLTFYYDSTLISDYDWNYGDVYGDVHMVSLSGKDYLIDGKVNESTSLDDLVKYYGRYEKVDIPDTYYSSYIFNIGSNLYLIDIDLFGRYLVYYDPDHLGEQTVDNNTYLKIE